MKLLQDSFSTGGWDYTLVDRTEKHFIYSKTAAFCDREGFEVFQRRITPAGRFVRGGEVIETEEKESFPKDEAFGKWAWSAISIEDAHRIASGIELHESAKGLE